MEEASGSDASKRLRLAADAARGSDATIESERDLPSYKRWDREERRLEAFFRLHGMPTAWTPPTGAFMLEGGNEHVLYKVGPNLYKVTKLDSYGKVLRYEPRAHDGLNMVYASPHEYLESLALRNDTFGDSVELVGSRRNRVLEIVTIMPFHDARKPTKPHPKNASSIKLFMAEWGFRQVGIGTYYHDEANVLVGDAKLDNFIDTPFGLAPVDLCMTQPDRNFREFLAERKSPPTPVGRRRSEGKRL